MGNNLNCAFAAIAYSVTGKASCRYQIRARNSLGGSAWTQTQVSAN
jgi:hypothetical protein